LGIAFGGDISMHNMIQCAKLAEQRRFDSVWTTDYYYYREPFSSLAALALGTEKVRLGVAVVNPYNRHPVVLAQTMASIDELSNGRAVLGLSTGAATWIRDEMGINQVKPLDAIREAVKIIRGLLSGKTMTFGGSVYELRGVQLTFKPCRQEIPIYLGAVSPKMLELAGEIGDGVIYSSVTPFGFVKYAKDKVETGMSRADRSLQRFDIADLRMFSTSDDPQESLNLIRPYVARLLSTDESDRLSRLAKIGAEDKAAIKDCWRKGDFRGAMDRVTDSMVDEYTIAGSPEACRKRIERYWEAGVNTLVLMPSGPDLNNAVRTAIEMNTNE
jgi:5,10-methylenetetrahydromethanopterin reductase